MAARKSYDRSVFINCPFDNQYRPLLRAAVFAVLRSGFYARSALEEEDSSEIRLHKIFRIIGECRFGIHDLSRITLHQGFPRFNMPLELGIFLAAKYFGREEQDRKGCLIFERTPHSYLRFISDIRGQDVHPHQNSPEQVVRSIRNWLANNSGRSLPGGAALWQQYRRFANWLPRRCRALELKENELTFLDYWSLVAEWIDQNP